MIELSKIPSWIIALSLLAILAISVLLIVLYISDNHLCYKRRLGFVKSEKQCIARKPGKPEPIPIEQIIQNEGNQPLYIFGFCNATNSVKDIEAYIGKNKSGLNLVSSESGTDRGAISFIVPPQWYYRIDRSNVSGISCTFNGWLF